MKKRILLIDESLTVQKVVALTLDKNKYAVSYARTRAEAMRIVVEGPPDLILVSDQVADLNVSSFPKEVEAWMGREQTVAPLVLITGQDIREFRHYASVLKKPFSPQALSTIVDQLTHFNAPASASIAPPMPVNSSRLITDDEGDDQMHHAFNQAFADESRLAKETLISQEFVDSERTLLTIPSGWPPQMPSPAQAQSYAQPNAPAFGAKKNRPSPPPPMVNGGIPQSAPNIAPQYMISPEAADVDDEATLWNATHEQAPEAIQSPRLANRPRNVETKRAPTMMQSKDIEDQIRQQPLDEMIDKALARLLPPIVERLVQAKLEQLLKEQEEWIEAKP